MPKRSPLACLLAPAISVLAALAGCGQEEGPRRLKRPHMDIPVVDQGHPGATPPQGPCGQVAAPQAPSAPAAPAGPFGTDQERAQVREWIRRLMDETRVVPDTAARKGGPRGGPGNFAKLSSSQVDEFVSAIIFAGDHFSPQSLPLDQRRVLVAVEISIESAFTPSTSGDNPGDSAFVSVGPLQLTISKSPDGPGMWDNTFRQYAKIPGLVHADNSAWEPSTTTREQFCTNIYDAIVASFWCITEQGRRGLPDWFGGPDGPAPKVMRYAFLGWVIGAPAARSGGDLAGQRDFYIASLQTDLKLLGYDPNLIETAV